MANGGVYPMDMEPLTGKSIEKDREYLNLAAFQSDSPNSLEPSTPTRGGIGSEANTYRTHRERKEHYMRSLETEVSRLREAYTNEISEANVKIQQQYELLYSIRDDNEILKELLRAHGIQYESELKRRRAGRPPMTAFQSSPVAISSTESQSALATSSNHNATPPTTVATDLSPRGKGIMDHSEVSPPIVFVPQQQVYHASAGEQIGAFDRSANRVMDPVPAMMRGVFESDPQLQIDFILTYVKIQIELIFLSNRVSYRLEGPCREHTDYLCRRSITEADDEDMPFSGHALMAHTPHKTYDLPLANLSTLLNLSRHLVTDGQITPIMALQCLKNHDLYHSLSRDDIKIIIETLNTKVRCYGFGAVVEDFELMDCMSSVMGTKFDLGVSSLRDDPVYA
ncbi:hypothetical protein N7495_004783 [Penicillium taxi]|uniref:uncharacterized protein n=1 Tax=Penicillium taxi TaxID=168475 RepID=UPI002545589A|nr:uncharacterized protein N7495_004783 [Penicillium taxi]KAJ5900039.1 hypothetical protein N7495_004783 [Penicillium taxi]